MSKIFRLPRKPAFACLEKAHLALPPDKSCSPAVNTDTCIGGENISHRKKIGPSPTL